MTIQKPKQVYSINTIKVDIVSQTFYNKPFSSHKRNTIISVINPTLRMMPHIYIYTYIVNYVVFLVIHLTEFIFSLLLSMRL